MSLFSSLLPPRPELQLYGKLPIAKDYLRIGCSEGSALAFREWLDRVFSTDAGDGRAPRLPWPMHFVLGAERGDVLVGSLWNSTDAGGERPFPFTLFVRRKRGEVKRSLPTSLATLVGAWEAIEQIREQVDRYQDGKELLREQRGQLVQPTEVDDRGGHVSLAEWLEVLWPGRGLDGVRETVKELSAAGRDHPAATRLPLAPRQAVTEQVRAWLFLLDLAGCSARAGVPSFFVPHLWSEELRSAGGDGPRSMFVTFRELQPSDVELLAAEELSDGCPPELPPAEGEPVLDAPDPLSQPLVESLKTALDDEQP